MNTTKKGDELELAIFNLFKAQIESDRFFATKECCRIFHRKGYYSRDRETEIIFDVSIEISMPGATEYSILVVIECKNYSGSVPVNDVEEFFTKVEQIGQANTKAIFISSAALQSGALTYCRSKRMGVARYFKAEDLKWELQRSASVSYFGNSAIDDAEVYAGLTRPDYKSSVFEFFLQSPNTSTNSVWTFLEDLLQDGLETDHPIRKLRGPRPRRPDGVPFMGASNLELQAHEALYLAGLNDEYADLDLLCARHPRTQGLKLQRIRVNAVEAEQRPLGRITFDPLTIELFETAGSAAGRDRFTLAHELGHLLLGHGRFLKAEWRDDADDEGLESIHDDGTALKRMEYQANYFASCLLMPREPFVAAFAEELRLRGLHDKGFGPLFVDTQECNLNNYHAVTARLMKRFGVSRQAVAIRLTGLKLLKDVRQAKPYVLRMAALDHLFDAWHG
jgi:Zn-dependent peptidase ImmA (M78 family)